MGRVVPYHSLSSVVWLLLGGAVVVARYGLVGAVRVLRYQYRIGLVCEVLGGTIMYTTVKYSGDNVVIRLVCLLDCRGCGCLICV